jgi:hypothetical protein
MGDEEILSSELLTLARIYVLMIYDSGEENVQESKQGGRVYR